VDVLMSPVGAYLGNIDAELPEKSPKQLKAKVIITHAF